MERMEKMFWMVCLIYVGLAAAAHRRGREGNLPFGLVGGWMVAFFCFCFLPPVFGGRNVLLSTVCALLGTLLATWAEKRRRRLWTALGCAASALMYGGLLGQASVPAAVMGGFCLYLACGEVLPEGKGERETLWQGFGALVGFLLGIFCCFP
ncbi:hypothetical protein H9X85_11570 [Anaerotignum lactatifermentans]|uniref:Prepilin type IV endopeptidase peptidase domain-containing protein n=1 Tax=Anaerotignum lactatifermentans TaxID=160404 RepID=A0ABS2GBB6_9FIRM|nr:hypothetical protein [Anaerotignum lactatifermentans]MBM6830220.1 hypothetical protein [Anaerotignum lactatifermentans]MBM6878769.1 hypothetical protein [Anaerotignum lactatifermentans]MBM6951833.1 hypothetical protein [Anaerotignum lactatifermentans]